MNRKIILELALVLSAAILVAGILAGKDPDRDSDSASATPAVSESTLSTGTTGASKGAESSGTTGASKRTDSSGSTESSGIYLTSTEEAGTQPAEEKPGTGIPGRLFQDAGFVTDSDGFCVLDEEGNIVIAKNEGAAYAPASITKVMTALVVLEHVSLSEKVVVREEDLLSVDIMSSGVTPSLKAGEVFTVEELLYALILPSTNAAGSVLGSYVAGSREAFAELMNEKLEELGLSHSHFVNPHGLDENGHYVCAYDMCVILKAACENPDLRKILGTSSYSLPATDYTSMRWIGMGHKMVTGEDYLYGVFAGKPGSSPKAGSSLVTAVERNGKTFYVCTLHSTSSRQYQDTRNIIEAAYAMTNGGSFRASSLIYGLCIDKVSGKEITASFRVANNPVAVNCRYYSISKGEGSAVVWEVPVNGEGRMTATFTVPDFGSYEFQVYLTGPENELTAVNGQFLCTGTTVGPGMLRWNGNTYYGKSNGMIYTGAVEALDGFYYAGADGSLLKGFVGRFFAGEDYSIVTGWFTANNKTFYAGGDGRIVTGRAMIGGTVYEFSEAGELIE